MLETDLNNNKSLFTLTTEEVEPLKNLLLTKLHSLKRDLRDWKEDEEVITYTQKEINIYQPILNRIKQWQDEILSRDNT